VCGYRTFRRVQDLNINRWSILTNKIWNSYHTSGASWTCNPVAPPIIPEGLKYKRILWKFLKFLIACCYICDFLCVFLFLWSKVGQILNYSGHCIEAWCVPSATCGSWLYQSQNTIQRIGVFLGLNFKSLLYAPCMCSVYSSKPKSIVRILYSIYMDKSKAIFKMFRLHVRTTCRISGHLSLAINNLNTGWRCTFGNKQPVLQRVISKL